MDEIPHYRRFIAGLAGRVSRILQHNPHLLARKLFPIGKAGDDGIDEPRIPAYGVYGSANGVRPIESNPSHADQERTRTGQSSPVTPEAM